MNTLSTVRAYQKFEGVFWTFLKQQIQRCVDMQRLRICTGAIKTSSKVSGYATTQNVDRGHGSSKLEADWTSSNPECGQVTLKQQVQSCLDMQQLRIWTGDMETASSKLSGHATTQNMDRGYGNSKLKADWTCNNSEYGQGIWKQQVQSFLGMH